MPTAIAREKELKRFGRKQKLALIEAHNPTWRDLYEDFLLPRHLRRDDT
jgi:predicted GIY-YIG superfamily endonuclease